MDDRDSRGADGGRPGGLGRVVPPDAESSDEYARWANKDRHPRDVDADADEKRPVPDAERDALDPHYAGEFERHAKLTAGIRDTGRLGYARILYRDIDGDHYAYAYHADAVRDRNRGSS
jgi:hypothetical protein